MLRRYCHVSKVSKVSMFSRCTFTYWNTDNKRAHITYCVVLTCKESRNRCGAHSPTNARAMWIMQGSESVYFLTKTSTSKKKTWFTWVCSYMYLWLSFSYLKEAKDFEGAQHLTVLEMTCQGIFSEGWLFKLYWLNIERGLILSSAQLSDSFFILIDDRVNITNLSKLGSLFWMSQ